MPRLTRRQPKYSHHPHSNRGRFCFQGKWYYLPGAYGSNQSRAAYFAALKRIEVGESPEDPQETTEQAKRTAADRNLLTIAELVERYWEHAKAYYRRDGKPTGEADAIRYALAPLLDLFPAVIASEFKPRFLKDTRQEMIARGWCRRYINASIRRVKAMFAWAVEEELVSPEVAGAIITVKALRAGRSPAREKPDIEPIDDASIEKILPHMQAAARDVILVMRYCGCRPGEVKRITVEAIDRSDPQCWTCPLGEHKTAWRGKKRTLYFGPKCQAILAPWIAKAGTGRVFPITHSGFRTAIARACQRAGIPRFGPNRLRHSAATSIRKQFGAEAAQVILGHAHIRTTEIYAEVNTERGREVAACVG